MHTELWPRDVAQSFFIPPELAGKLAIDDGREHRLVDVFTDRQMGECHRGADLKWDLHVEMGAGTRLQWLRLELCE